MPREEEVREREEEEAERVVDEKGRRANRGRRLKGFA